VRKPGRKTGGKLFWVPKRVRYGPKEGFRNRNCVNHGELVRRVWQSVGKHKYTQREIDKIIRAYTNCLLMAVAQEDGAEVKNIGRLGAEIQRCVWIYWTVHATARGKVRELYEALVNSGREDEERVLNLLSQLEPGWEEELCREVCSV
jgi:hypothetical protein